MKTIYEVEMRELKKDNAQKQLLITTVHITKFRCTTIYKVNA